MYICKTNCSVFSEYDVSRTKTDQKPINGTILMEKNMMLPPLVFIFKI